jgi:hypothetical protein
VLVVGVEFALVGEMDVVAHHPDIFPLLVQEDTVSLMFGLSAFGQSWIVDIVILAVEKAARDAPHHEG